MSMKDGVNMYAVKAGDLPDEMRKELEVLARENDGVLLAHLIPPHIKEWLDKHGGRTEGKEAIKLMIEQKMPEMLSDISLMTEGIRMLPTVIDKDASDKLLREYYNKCAEFCRQYNSELILGADKD